MNSLWLVWILGVSLHTAGGANILVFLPLPFTSHTLAFKPLFVELASRGHNVTYVGSIALPETQNLHQTIVKDSNVEEVLENLVAALRSTPSPWTMFPFFWKYGAQIVDIMSDNPVTRRFIEDETLSFDLIIIEPFFYQEPFLAFGHKFRAPIVGIFPLSPTIWASHLSGNPMPFSYVPTYKSSFSDHMSLQERISNTMLQLYEFVGTKYYYLPMQEEVATKKFVYKGSENRPPLSELATEVSLHLLDYHFSSSYSRPLENNMLQVGGLTLARSKLEPLDKDLQALMDASKGVIYLSLGGHLKVSLLGEHSVKTMMYTFAQFSDYQILLKWNEAEPPPNKPPNVFTSTWFPQPSVLGHPKCKMMIGHGGLHGIMESIHNGIPYIGIPFFSDQEYNIRFVASRGFGLRVGQDELTSTKFHHAIATILGNNTFKENAMKRLAISRDRVMDPLELAIYGVEYVLRHNGAEHLRPAVLDLYWYEYILLDVVAVLVLLPLALLGLIYKVSKRLFSNKTG